MFFVSLFFIYGLLSEDYLTLGISFVAFSLFFYKNNTFIALLFMLMLCTFYKRYFFDIQRYDLLNDTRYTFNLLNIFNICPCELYEKGDNHLKTSDLKVPLLLYLPPILFVASYRFLSLCK
jgi:hypothetical protein